MMSETRRKKSPVAERCHEAQVEEAARFEVMRLLLGAPLGYSTWVLAMKNADVSWIDVLTFALEKMGG